MFQSSEIRLFYGSIDHQYYFAWEEETTAYLDYYGYLDDQCMELVTRSFRGVAYNWWVDVFRYRRT